VKGNSINQVNPGVFFYYAFVAVSGGTTNITVTQSNNGSWIALTVNSASQVILYDLNCGKVLIGTQSANGTVTFANVPNGSYIIGIQYSANSVVGQPQGHPLPTVTYTFDSANASGSASVPFQPK
jgi:hypothetical protein